MTKPKVLLCVDPGGTIGIAIFNDQYQPIELEHVPATEFNDYLLKVGEKYEVMHIVVEDYIIRRNKAQAHVGSKVPAAQQIGKLELMAQMWGCQMTKQQANILNIALKWSGIKMPHAHSETHKWCAYLHGYYYMKQKGLIMTALEIEEEAKRNNA